MLRWRMTSCRPPNPSQAPRNTDAPLDHPPAIPRYPGPACFVARGLTSPRGTTPQTRGYRHHPQLQRFQAHASPRFAINAYLAAIHSEATARGYAFDKRKIGPVRSVDSISATTGQIAYEWQHLMAKLAVRNQALRRHWRKVRKPLCHPLFKPVPGAVEQWERIAQPQR